MGVFLHAYLCNMIMFGAYRGQKRTTGTPRLELQLPWECWELTSPLEEQPELLTVAIEKLEPSSQPLYSLGFILSAV